MSMKPEVKVKRRIREALNSWGHPVYTCMPIGSQYGTNGDPDFVCCIDGRLVGIEAKANGEIPTKLQTDRLIEIIESGGIALVIDANNVGQLTSTIRSYLDEPQPIQDYLARAIAHWDAKEKATSAGDVGDGITLRVSPSIPSARGRHGPKGHSGTRSRRLPKVCFRRDGGA